MGQQTRALSLSSMECADCPIRHRALCSKCEADELARLEAVKYYRTYAPGETVIWAGERLDFVASVVRGVATLSHTLEDGRRQMVGLMLPSDFLGRPSRASVNYDITAVSELTLCCFRRQSFNELIRNVPHLSQRLLEMTLDELDAAREWMLVLGRKTAREKIASLLVIIARRDAMLKATPQGDTAVFDLPLTREAMADYLGLTLETVSRQMTALRKDGVIEIEGKRHITVPDFDLLVCETGDDADGGMLV